MEVQKTSQSGFSSDHACCKTSSFLIHHILTYRCMVEGMECAYRMHVSGYDFCTHADRNDFSGSVPA